MLVFFVSEEVVKRKSLVKSVLLKLVKRQAWGENGVGRSLTF